MMSSVPILPQLGSGALTKRLSYDEALGPFEV